MKLDSGFIGLVFIVISEIVLGYFNITYGSIWGVSPWFWLVLPIPVGAMIWKNRAIRKAIKDLLGLLKETQKEVALERPGVILAKLKESDEGHQFRLAFWIPTRFRTVRSFLSKGRIYHFALATHRGLYSVQASATPGAYATFLTCHRYGDLSGFYLEKDYYGQMIPSKIPSALEIAESEEIPEEIKKALVAERIKQEGTK